MRAADHRGEQAQRQDKTGQATLAEPRASRLLARGKVAETRDTTYGPSHRVLSGLTGPNDRHATLVTCWLIEDRAGLSVPRLTTVWVQPHRDKETER